MPKHAGNTLTRHKSASIQIQRMDDVIKKLPFNRTFVLEQIRTLATLPSSSNKSNSCNKLDGTDLLIHHLDVLATLSLSVSVLFVFVDRQTCTSTKDILNNYILRNHKFISTIILTSQTSYNLIIPCSSHILFSTQVYQNVTYVTGVATPEPPSPNMLVTATADNSRRMLSSTYFVEIPFDKMKNAQTTYSTKANPDTGSNSEKQQISSIRGISPETDQSTEARVALTTPEVGLPLVLNTEKDEEGKLENAFSGASGICTVRIKHSVTHF